MDAGELVPDELTLSLLIDRSSAKTAKAATSWTVFPAPCLRPRA